MKKFLTYMCCLFLSGCALTSWSELKNSPYRDNARKFEATIPLNWMKYNFAREFIMTNDGTMLDYVAVERRKIDEKLEVTKKFFEANMTPQELAEVEIDNFKSDANISFFKVTKNIPFSVDGFDSFRLEYEYTAKGGLLVEGINIGFIKDKFVYRIRYEASQIHYFEKYLPEFESFIKSFNVID